MRILIINSEYPPVGGGASNASQNVARILADLGQDVTVLTAQYADLPPDSIEDGVRVLRGPARRKSDHRSGAWEQGLFMLLGSWGALRLLRTWRPDVVIAYFGIPSGAPAIVLRWLFGIPYLVSLRGGDVPGFRSYDFAFYHRLMAPLIRLIWRQSAAVVANSQGLSDLATAFYPQMPVKIIPNGVAVERFPEMQRDWDEPHMLIVGRVVYQKGIDLLLQALHNLMDRPWRLTVVGDGPELPKLRQMTDEYGLTGHVDFAGWQDRAELPTYYQQANLFVYPSRDEGMPNVVLEAMAAGLPVIASKIAGSEELVLPEENGLLIPPEDADALQAALERLLPDAETRQQMGDAARQTVQKNYTWHSVAEQYLAIVKGAQEQK